ncbi:LuxR C-terminal-related transcriptional regulator [Nonomuraea angiospora]|uniref:DNA-binding NarL/FixJ family response regulator n=1 Tax=Nonomuraea angiospora TaxID=46172 RepID=A0ABR9M8S1_9ACTN|nr:response regulator transcription factor [Nonomuraea angiospora]MBE1589314.1 DNA-binding NarL/FixJ family response regulator [Nonomuraea angiospora]
MRVVLAEDVYLLREGLTHLLRAHGIDIVAAVDTGDELLDALAGHRPDLAIVDVRLPPGYTDEGVRAAVEARKRHPGFPVLVLSQYVEQIYARELLADGAGGVGYLLKDRVFDTGHFVDALRRVAAGGTAMDPEVISKLLGGTSPQHPLALLTPRERDVLQLMAQGRSNAAIAGQLFVSEGTVGKHIAAIFTKLDIEATTDTNRRVLAVLAYLNQG